MPIAMEKTTASTAAGMLMATRVPLTREMTSASTIPTITPISPPKLVSTAATVRNCHRI